MTFSTPYGGTVANVIWVNSGAGPYQQFSCRGQLIPGQSFYACVKINWIDVIVRQLCRFPG
jgi:hypothetical protein